MVSVKDAFARLGIEATEDKKAIKRAYAKCVKEVHPEESPDEWHYLHDAYKCAVRYADNCLSPFSGSTSVILDEDAAGLQVNTEMQTPIRSSDEYRREAVGGAQEDVQSFFSDMGDERRKEILQVVIYMRDVLKFEHPKKAGPYLRWQRKWEHFLEDERFDSVSREFRFWDTLYSFMKQETISAELLEILEPKLMEQKRKPEELTKEEEAIIDELLETMFKVRSINSKATFFLLVMTGAIVYVIYLFIKVNYFPG